MNVDDHMSRAKDAPETARSGGAHAHGIDNVLDSVTDGVQVLDADAHIVYMNRESRRLLRERGVEPDSVLGKHFWNEAFPHTRGTPLQRAYMHAMQSREVTDFDNYYEPWQRWYSIRIFPADGGGIIVYFRDTTQRKRAALLLQEQRDLLALIAGGAPLDRCLTAVTESIARLNPGLRACALLADRQVRTFASCHSGQLPATFTDAIRGLPIDDSNIGTCGEAVFKGISVACESVATDTRWSQTWRWLSLEHGIRACHSDPIRGRSGQAIGSLMLCFSEARSITAWEFEIAKLAGSAASVAIEHARSLEASEARFHHLAAIIPHFVWHWTADGTLQYMNRAWLDYSGCNPELTRDVGALAEYLHPEDIRALLSAWFAAKATRDGMHVDVRLRNREGAYARFRIGADPLEGGSTDTHWLALVTPLTG